MTQKLITDYFKASNKKRKRENFEVGTDYETDSKLKSWYCTICDVDMGIHNPRQLCGKYYCKNILFLY